MTRVRTQTAALLCLSLVACSLGPGPHYARPAIRFDATPLPPPELLERIEVDDRRTIGKLLAGDEEVRFEVRRCASGDASPQPLVLIVPILAGGKELMDMVAERMVARGFDVAFCARAGSALSPPQRAPDLDELFRRTVLHQRALLAWLRAGERAPPEVHVLGLSMGGMVTTVLAAHEPDLDGVAICLSGADLAGLVLVSSERRVRRWVDWRRQADGIGDDTLRWELRQFLDHEPLRFAPAVETDKVLFVSAAFDTVVPRRNQDLLWEALGRPQRLDVPFGHYSAALAIGRVIGAAAEHFRNRSVGRNARRPTE